MKKDKLIGFNREHITEAAKKLFKKNGVEKTTMDDIAKEAEYSKSTIYVYFKSKNEIYNTVILEYFLIFKKTLIKTAEKNISFVKKYYEVCENILSFRKKHPLYFDVMMSKISVNKKDLETNPILKKIYDTGEEINLAIKTMLEQGADEKILPEKMDMFETTFFLHASIHGLIIAAYNKEEYFKLSLGKSIDDFLHNSFERILKSLTR